MLSCESMRTRVHATRLEAPQRARWSARVDSVYQRLADASHHIREMLAVARRADASTAARLPEPLRASIERLSGVDLVDVQVHHNSPVPAQLGAHAHADANTIHVGPGQDQHLPHEAWHVVQQRQGRVRATNRVGRVAINDEPALESEADRMGQRVAALSRLHTPSEPGTQPAPTMSRAARTPAVVQCKTALQTFNDVLREAETEIGSLGSKHRKRLAGILGGLAKLNQCDKNNAEQCIFFGTAWKGSANDNATQGDDRAMLENLIQANLYGIGDALREARQQSDIAKYLNAKPEDGVEHVYDAFRNALFFRAERKDSNASQSGRLDYNSEKHGKKGSASVMPGGNASRVQDRADKHLFVTKNFLEAADYAKKAQGGERELLVIIASRSEVDAMVYDVDSGGYKTQNALTGIVAKPDEMTEHALDNLNSWLPPNLRVDAKVASKALVKVVKVRG